VVVVGARVARARAQKNGRALRPFFCGEFGDDFIPSSSIVMIAGHDQLRLRLSPQK
jgi:hypothetical protein